MVYEIWGALILFTPPEDEADDAPLREEDSVPLELRENYAEIHDQMPS